MVFTKEMFEILTFLATQKDYAIFAGFATEIHTGLESSADIDVYFPNKNKIKSVVNKFLKMGWKVTRNMRINRSHLFITLEKNNTTFDLETSDMINLVSLPNKERVVFRNKQVYTICKEELFFEKMIGASLEGRRESKQERDKKAVQILRKKVDNKKIKHLLEIFPAKYFI